jgi:SAM-dependent methyltransferase
VLAVRLLPRLLNPLSRLRQRWPVPALLAWGLGWGMWALMQAMAMPALVSYALGAVAGAVAAWPCRGLWRKALAGAGFPLSALALGAAAGMPAWGWLLLLLPLLAAYPLRAWQDAPFFPTPSLALQGLDKLMPAPARVLDAGCGLGHGLSAFRLVWPQAELQGVEWSASLVWLARLRCRAVGLKACVWRGDMWATSWAGQDVVYVFQRPESMPRVFAKAARELSPGAWLVSLEFEVPGQRPAARWHRAGAKPVWLYQPAGAAAERAGSARSTPLANGR